MRFNFWKKPVGTTPVPSRELVPGLNIPRTIYGSDIIHGPTGTLQYIPEIYNAMVELYLKLKEMEKERASNPS